MLSAAFARFISRWLLALTLAIAASACRRDSPESAKAPPVVRSADHRFPIRVGDQMVKMRLAIRAEEQRRGLMYITAMPEDEGMLFLYPRPQRMSFWMRNTELPLDIGYFDAAGELQEVYPMYPRVDDAVPSVSEKLQFALEMNQGWYARHGVRPGARLDLAALAGALRDRGFKPEEFGLNP